MLKLYPMSYSKRKTVEKIALALAEAPEQKPGSPEAFDGKVMEFHTENNRMPGTLLEINQVLGINEFTIVAEDGTINIEKEGDIFIEKNSAPEDIRKAYYR